ncbi:adenosine deaminase [Candidatus Izemoplasma sp. B36]|uniref:adenosine deaminase n=1 Tax=Candidatus Izemoplasma sp. B36 TaxID=3242468 RepID=UPI003555F6A8
MMKLNKTELHIHLIQSLKAEDLINLSKLILDKIDWNRFSFLDRFGKLFGFKPNMEQIILDAIKTNDLSEFKKIAVYNDRQNGTFEKFDIKSFLPYCITGYYYDNDQVELVLEKIVDRHIKEGIEYIEYRNGFYGEGKEWRDWHARFARYLKSRKTEKFNPKYIVRLGNYTEVKKILEENPDLIDTILGIDFSGREQSPLSIMKFYKKYNEDLKNKIHKLQLVVHIGEDFFDKSLDSAIRWIHQTALFGAKRLAHCIGLGMDPLVAINRKKDAHAFETIKERLDQIEYDIKYVNQLNQFGISVDIQKLESEYDQLNKRDHNELIRIDYTREKLEEIRLRQNFVLSELKKLNTIIEICPTSNLVIGNVLTYKDHSLHKILASEVDVVICTDDPGIFDITLSDEFSLLQEMGYSLEYLKKRLKDPLMFTLEQLQNRT